jgi:hypothetical protein
MASHMVHDDLYKTALEIDTLRQFDAWKEIENEMLRTSPTFPIEGKFSHRFDISDPSHRLILHWKVYCTNRACWKNLLELILELAGVNGYANIHLQIFHKSKSLVEVYCYPCKLLYNF